MDLIAEQSFPAYFHIARSPGISTILNEEWQENRLALHLEQWGVLKSQVEVKMNSFQAEPMQEEVVEKKMDAKDGPFVSEERVLVNIPFLTFFVELSPSSKVPVSPKVNNRHVRRELFKQDYSLEKDTSFEAALKSPFGTNLQRFFLSCYPYALSDKNIAGCELQSFSTRNEGDRVYVITTPETATYVLKEHYDTVMKLFNQKVGQDVTWSHLLNSVGNIKLATSEDIDKFVQKCDLPTSIFGQLKAQVGTEIQHYEPAKDYPAKLDRLRHFIQLCTKVRFGFPEGQHHMEAAVRALYGFNFEQNDCLERQVDFQIHPENSIFTPNKTLVLKLTQEDIQKRVQEPYVAEAQLKDFKELIRISRRYANETEKTFKSSHRDFMYNFLQDMKVELKRDQDDGLVEFNAATNNNAEGDCWHKCSFSTQRSKDKPIRLDAVHKRQQKILLMLTQRILEGGNPYSGELKNQLSIERIKNLLDKSQWKFWGADVARCFINPYNNVSATISSLCI